MKNLFILTFCLVSLFGVFRIVEAASDEITQIGFNPVDQPPSFIVGLPNITSKPLRIRAQNIDGLAEAVTGTDQYLRVKISSDSPTGYFDTSTVGDFTETNLILDILSPRQNTDNFFYRDTSAGEVNLTAEVIDKSEGLINLAIGYSAPLNKTVDQADSIITLSSATNPSLPTEDLELVVTVSHSSPDGVGIPSGVIKLKETGEFGETDLAESLELDSAGVATVSISDLLPGLHSLFVVYEGDDNFQGSTSDTVVQEIMEEVVEVDPDLPVIILIGEELIVVEAGSTYVDFGATAWDQDDGDLTDLIEVTGLPIDTLILGEHIVTYQVNNLSDNSALPITRTITVVDTTPPVLSSVVDREIEVGGPSVVNYDYPVASDMVDGVVEVICSPSSGTIFDLGTTLVTCQAVDLSNNSASETFSVLLYTSSQVPEDDNLPVLVKSKPKSNLKKITPPVLAHTDYTDPDKEAENWNDLTPERRSMILWPTIAQFISISQQSRPDSSEILSLVEKLKIIHNPSVLP